MKKTTKYIAMVLLNFLVLALSAIIPFILYIFISCDKEPIGNHITHTHLSTDHNSADYEYWSTNKGFVDISKRDTIIIDTLNSGDLITIHSRVGNIDYNIKGIQAGTIKEMETTHIKITPY